VTDRLTRRQMLERCAAMVGGFALIDRRACLEGARIRWIVGWSPGGGFDTYSRLAEPFIEDELGAEIAIDNVPGAGGRVGALMLSRARPDGRTLGILNGSGFLWDREPGASSMPHLSRDFTVLARVSRRQQVVMASPASGLDSVQDLVALSRRRPIVAGITAPDSSNFASLAAVSDLLGVATEFIAGYPGSTEVALGLHRGDCDITSLDVESFLQTSMLVGVRALLQMTPERSPDPRIADVPHLAGASGLISTAPQLFAGDPVRARAIAGAIVAYLEIGRLFAGPGGMQPELRDCVELGMRQALLDPGFAAAARRAGRSIDYLPGEEIRSGVPAAMEAVRPMAPVVAAAARRIR
jgi:tripartite-type tricarboxylate transporter receptor subunit TctC